MKKQTSNQSPKNRYRVQFNYANHIDEIGHVSSYTTNSINDLEKDDNYLHRARRGKATVTIYENKATYPAFEWQVINQIRIK